MDSCIIDNVNRLVKQNDTLWFLGDFCMGNYQDVIDYRKRVNCNNFNVVLGNHDKWLRKLSSSLVQEGIFSSIQEYAEIDVDVIKVCLFHYCILNFNKAHFGSYHLWGHSHGSLPENPKARSFDVGINCWDYKPVSWDQVKAKMSTKEWKPIDHHTRKR